MNSKDELKELAVAIAHARHVEETTSCPDCAKDHAQLAKWLTELLEAKTMHHEGRKAAAWVVLTSAVVVLIYTLLGWIEP
jgi:hypothetical protein